MRHSFRIPKEMRNAVIQHIDTAIQGVKPEGFQQEPAIVVALISRMIGVAYEGEFGSVEFRATSINDRGRGAAERKYGADFVITVDISDQEKSVSKAIVSQAKKGEISELSKKEKERLNDQIKRMINELGYERPQVMEILQYEGKYQPKMVSGTNYILGKPCNSRDLSAYFIDCVLTTKDGNTNPQFVKRVQDSSLPKLNTFVHINPGRTEQLRLFE